MTPEVPCAAQYRRRIGLTGKAPRWPERRVRSSAGSCASVAARARTMRRLVAARTAAQEPVGPEFLWIPPDSIEVLPMASYYKQADQESKGKQDAFAPREVHIHLTAQPGTTVHVTIAGDAVSVTSSNAEDEEASSWDDMLETAIPATRELRCQPERPRSDRSAPRARVRPDAPEDAPR